MKYHKWIEYLFFITIFNGIFTALYDILHNVINISACSVSQLTISDVRYYKFQYAKIRSNYGRMKEQIEIMDIIILNYSLFLDKTVLNYNDIQLIDWHISTFVDNLFRCCSEIVYNYNRKCLFFIME